MRLRCRIGLHPWPRWSAPQDAVENYGRGQRECQVQTKTCSGCGKMKVRRVDW